MSEAFQIFLIVISDIMIYITYPVHLRLMYVLLKRRSSELDPAFQILLANLTTFNILVATSHMFILEPAGQGLLPEFYADNALWLGRIELIKTTTLAFCMIFSMLIGVNRLTAFAVPFKQAFIWTPRNTRILCAAVWCFIIASSIPIVVGDSTNYRFKNSTFGLTSVEFIFVGVFDQVYPQAGLLYIGVFEAVKIAIHAAIILLMRRYKKTQQKLGSYKTTFSKNVYRMTAAAAVNSLGGWSIFAFFAAYYICQWTTGTRLVTFTYYSLILRLTTAFNNMLTPWVMLVSFKGLRRLFLGRYIGGDTTVVGRLSSSMQGK